ncbi:MAG: hypothetical protein IKN97_06480 [Lachnospiraceae bacterium]|nr:hypothetical protein [Lachnospiraceae bacterium]
MGKIFNINRRFKGTEPKDSGLADFENDIVSLDETGSIELPDDASEDNINAQYENYDEDYDEVSDETDEAEELEEVDETDEVEELEEVDETDNIDDSEEADETFDSEESEYYDEASDETGAIDEIPEDAEDYDESEETGDAEESEYYDDDYEEASDEIGAIDEIPEDAEDYDESEETGDAEESGYYDDDYDEVSDEIGDTEEYDEVSDETGVIEDFGEVAAIAEGSLEEIEYPEEVADHDNYSDDDPTLGFDEVRLDTATINAADLAAYVKGTRIRELRQSGAYSEDVCDVDAVSESAGASGGKASAKETSYGKPSGKRTSEKSISGKSRSDKRKPEAASYDEADQDLGSDEYVNLDAPHNPVIKAPEKDKNNVLKLLVIAAACIALLAVGIFGIKGLLHRGGSSSGSVVRMNDAGLPVADELMGVGSELGSIDSIGRAGIDAAINATMSGGTQVVDVPVPDTSVIPHTDYNENELVISTRVSIELITVKSDLKIRFINADTGKLIPNIPFQVVITDPSGKTLNWTDDDLDGIIYKTSISEGKYKVHVEPLSGDKYSDYSWPSDNNVTVKSTIDYAKVDVGDEVKDASQVNENAEDTASRGNTSELDPTNTVAFVESSVSPMYTEISKDTITNPLAALILQEPDAIVLVSENSVSGNQTVSGNGADSGNGGGTTVSNNDSGNTPSVSGNGEQPGSNGQGTSVSANDTPAPKPGVSVTVSPATLSLKTGAAGTVTFSYSLTNVEKADKIDVVSSNTSVATVSSSHSEKDKTVTVTVTAVAGGTCDITVTVTTAKTDKVTETATASAKCTVTVTNVDMTQPLKDKSGNVVYVFENNAYRAATFADYAKFDKFYIVTGTKYTGWQTINGSTYYYDANGKVVTGTQVIQGVTYMFAADGKMTSTSGVLGIDVSKWNGNIDWAAVKASGVDYVIIRVGYRGSTAGALIDDSRFVANINGAKGAGLRVGVYFVTQAINDVEAVYEASMVLDRIKGYSLDLPVFLDVEPSGGRGDRIDKATRTSVIIAFCETIRSAGYSAGVYANKTWLDTKMDASQLGNYKIWVAHYSSVCGYTGRYDMWQYTDKGTISGITGSVDLNLRYS